MKDEENRFKVELDPERGRFTNGFALRDMKDGRCLAYIADRDDALSFLELKARQSDPKRWREGAYNKDGDLIKDVVDALFTAFREYLPDDDHEAKVLLRKHVFAGKLDPGQWSPNASAIVHIEALMIPGNEEVRLIEQWAKASEALGGAGFEQINSAVVGVYTW